jgi:FMN-dependent NADH-azoreductase
MSGHLLHIDTSINGENSVSRALSRRAADRWRETHEGGTVTYRDLAAEPLPHLDAASGLARMTAPDAHTPAQAQSWALTLELVGEVRDADTILLGLPLYNFGPPSVVKAWIDHLVAPGISIDVETMTGMLGGRELLVLASRGGGYGAGTPREGWDHAEPWLAHALSQVGLEPRFITTELTLAHTVPAMADLAPLAAESRARAEREIDELWSGVLA